MYIPGDQEISRGPRDFPRPKRFPEAREMSEAEVRGKSLGRKRECSSQYIPIWVYRYNIPFLKITCIFRQFESLGSNETFLLCGVMDEKGKSGEIWKFNFDSLPRERLRKANISSAGNGKEEKKGLLYQEQNIQLSSHRKNIVSLDNLVFGK